MGFDIYSVKKYNNAKGYKLQILSSYSVFAINGATKEKSEMMHQKLMDRANYEIEKREVKYYIIEDYQEPNYGIMGLNVRVFDSEEIKNKYIENNEKAKIRAQKEYEKYLIKRAKADEIEKVKKDEDDKLLERLYEELNIDKNKIDVKLPRYDGMSNFYSSDLVVSVGSEEVEKVLKKILVKPEYSKNKKVIGKNYLSYEVVNKVINWLNNNTDNYKFKEIDKNYRIRLPMAYCQLDKEKYPYRSKQYIKAYDYLINYEAVAYDIRRIER